MKSSQVRMFAFGAVVALPLSLYAQQSQNQQPQNQQSQSQQQNQTGQSGQLGQQDDTSLNGGGGVDTSLMKDMLFVRKATEQGLEAVKFGELAQQKSTNADVKSFGLKVIEDHKAYDKQLAPVADELGIRFADKMTKETKVEFDKLNALSGADFDKEYLVYVMTSHRKELRDFRTEETATPDPMVKDVVVDGEKVIVGHLRAAYTLAKAQGIVVQRPADAPAARATAPPK